MSAISEEELRALSKQFGTIIPRREPVTLEEITRLESMLLELLETAETAQLSSPHRAAACNALCGFVDATCSSGISRVRSVSLNPVIWNRLRSFYLDRYQDASPRSMRQFLSTLANLMRASQGEPELATSRWAEDVGQICLRSISSHLDLSSLKPSMLFLQEILKERLLKREVFTELLCTVQRETNQDSTATLDDLSTKLALHQLVADILKCCKPTDIASTAGRLLKTIFARNSLEISTETEAGLSADAEQPVWLTPILSTIRDGSVELDILEKHILPQLLASDERSLLQLFQGLPFQRLLEGNNNIDESDIRISMLLVTVIGTMKLSAVLTSQIQSLIRMPFPDLREKLALSCFLHQSAFVRIDAANLIVGTVVTAYPFSGHVLNSLQSVLKSLYVESDAKVRGDVLSISKYLTKRLSLVMPKLKKTTEYQKLNTVPVASIINQEDVLRQHQTFVYWLHDFLLEGLRPSASYQSHIMSLRVLGMASTLALFVICEIELSSATLIHQLKDLVLDPFEDVRSYSAALIVSAQLLDHRLFDSTKPTSFISMAKNRMIATGRANVSDGYARLVELSFHKDLWPADLLMSRTQVLGVLLADIKRGLAAAELDILEAVKRPQLHGQFSALRYIIMSSVFSQLFEAETEWVVFRDTIIDYCTRAWEIVKPILCIDSPEGNGDEEDVQDAGIGVKDTLSYSWRTLKEASALLQALIEKPRFSGLSFKDSRRIGDLCFTQLSELRHRGAFSSVAQCFTSCCIKDGHRTDESGISLVQRWHKQLLGLIDAQSVALTRRSAGLPAINVAILSASSDDSFHDAVFAELRSIASREASADHRHGETGLPQVHAMNCLRAIFGNSRVASVAERYLEKTVQIAVQSLDHDIWSIRNCGGMLLKAILVRLNSGINAVARENRSGRANFAKKVYRRYPLLADTVESLLQASIPSSDSTGQDQTNRQVNNGFPALEIIERIGVKKERMIVVQGLLFKLLESPVWFVRERAAEAISRFVHLNTILAVVQSTFVHSTEPQRLHANTLHGRLMCLKAGIEQCLPVSPHLFLLRLLENFEAILSLSCPVISTTYFDTLATILRGFLSDLSSPNDTLSADNLWQLENCLLSLKKLVSKKETVNPSSLNLQVLLSMLLYTVNPNAYHHLNPPSIINESNMIFVVQILIERNQEALVGQHLLSILMENCASMILEDCESPTTLELIEKLTMLLVYKREEISHTGDLILWSESMEKLLSACEAIHGRNRTASRASLELSSALLPLCEPNSKSAALMGRWIRRVRFATNDELDLAMRLSAIQALDNAKELVRERLWPASGNLLDQDAHLLLSILFDGLVDDDEDVRSLVGQLVSYVLRPSKMKAQNAPSLNFVAAQDNLLRHAMRYEGHSSGVFLESLARLLNLDIHHKLSSKVEFGEGFTNPGQSSNTTKTASWPMQRPGPGPLELAVRNALIEDNALFEVERQNLYRDNVQQMQLWADILMSMQYQNVKRIAEAIFPDFTTTYCQWAVAGLQAIASSGSTEWISSRDRFEVVCRVLIFTRVVLSWHPLPVLITELKRAVLAVEDHLQPVHTEHSKLVDKLKLHFDTMQSGGV